MLSATEKVGFHYRGALEPGQLRRACVARANPRGVPVKQGRAVFAESGPAPSSPASRALNSPDHTIFISRVKRTVGGGLKGRLSKQSAAGYPFCKTKGSESGKHTECDNLWTHNTKTHIRGIGEVPILTRRSNHRIISGLAFL
ncbi:hypothetical protein JG688_00017990 [Phytophthora aleatoria]|uniref:Uncharacterized protein n=1 Tax=Phytophthora aleatoria TaxID=2496075 RepID=A0A8J5MBT2_9STRA|nr:hypothetical protein JG688_00017990 [Phytophthora aleatoria]